MLLIFHYKYLPQVIFMANIKKKLLLISNFHNNVTQPNTPSLSCQMSRHVFLTSKFLILGYLYIYLFCKSK